MPINHAVRNDFDGDHRSDILWRSDSGDLSDWLGQSDGTFVINDSNAFTNVASNWQIVATGDFNGDGRVDLLWRSDDGQLSDWLGQSNGGFSINDAHSLTAVSADWKVVATGDFNGDGRDDILWRNSSTFDVSNWLANADGGFTINDANAHVSVPADWQIVGTGDFNGDGHADILWSGTADRALATWFGTDTGGWIMNDSQERLNTQEHVIGIGDFNGDGVSDIITRTDYSSSIDEYFGSGDRFVVNLSAHQIPVPTDWQLVGTGDYNGDSFADLLWRNNNGQLIEWLGQADGSFVADSSSPPSVTSAWHVQPSLLAMF